MASIGDQITKQYPKSDVLDYDGLSQTLKKLQDLKKTELQAPSEWGRLDNSDVYVITPRVNGLHLNEIIPKNEGLSIASLWPLVTQIASSLSVAHESGIFHLNLTPDCIYVVKDENDNESIVITGLGENQFLKSYSSVENKAKADANALADIINYALSGHKEAHQDTFNSVADVLSAYSEKHRAAILVHTDLSTTETPSENLTEFGLGRLFILSAAIAVLGAIALLYYWLLSGS